MVFLNIKPVKLNCLKTLRSNRYNLSNFFKSNLMSRNPIFNLTNFSSLYDTAPHSSSRDYINITTFKQILAILTRAFRQLRNVVFDMGQPLLLLVRLCIIWGQEQRVSIVHVHFLLPPKWSRESGRLHTTLERNTTFLISDGHRREFSRHKVCLLR